MGKIIILISLAATLGTMLLGIGGCSFRDLNQALRDNQTTGQNEPLRKERGEGVHGKRERPADRAPASEGQN